MWTGRKLRYLPQPVVDATFRAYATQQPTYGGRPACEWHFDAMKRLLDKQEPDYKE